MKVYTRGGDAGETSLFGGRRVSKSSGRIAAYGDVDELNSTVGLAIASLPADLCGDLRTRLETIQSALFDIGSELASPDAAARGRAVPQVGQGEVDELEEWIDQLEGELDPLRSFVLPGGTPGAAALHLARTICRRAERHVVSLGASEPISEVALRYMNRLSDLLFVMARAANHRAGVHEPLWVGRERLGEGQG